MSGGIEREISYSHSFTGTRFIVPLAFNSQFFPVYITRLSTLRSRIDSSSVQGDTHVEGILIRQHINRLSIVNKYTGRTRDSECRAARTVNYFSLDDKLFIELDSGRIQLDLSETEGHIEQLVTGLIVGVSGDMQANSTLLVKDIVFPSIAPLTSSPTVPDEFLCFISGLEIGSTEYDQYTIHVFANWLLGNIPTNIKAEKVVRLIILGNSLHKPIEARGLDRKAVSDRELKGFTHMAEHLKYLDSVLALFAGILPVDLIPGDMDPTNTSWPQQPLSPHLLPTASCYSALTSYPNPYECVLDGKRLLCTSGGNITDLSQFADPELSCCELAELTLKCGHLVPTAPDSLALVPLQGIDPFVLDVLPDLYVIGGMPVFSSKVGAQGTRIVTVPRFSAEDNIVLVNRNSLEVESFTIKLNAGN